LERFQGQRRLQVRGNLLVVWPLRMGFVQDVNGLRWIV
jgi:hypothetical protein